MLMGHVSKTHSALGLEERGSVNITHKCADPEKKERSRVNAGRKQEQPLQEVWEQQINRDALALREKSFHSFSKYILSTNQVLDR